MSTDKILPYAEDINYWKTSASGADAWLEKTSKLIQRLGGKVLAEGYGSEPGSGRAAFMLTFEISGERYQIIWPVLPTRLQKDERAARVQAATFLYHDTKAKCLKATIFGARTAFFEYVMLPDGRTASQVTTPELVHAIPEMFAPALGPGNFIDGDWKEE